MFAAYKKIFGHTMLIFRAVQVGQTIGGRFCVT